ncbi:hypothetical protein OSTOST_19456 [Ostertagia ostertagi]
MRNNKEEKESFRTILHTPITKERQVLFIGHKELCEMKSASVTTDGELVEDSLDVSSEFDDRFTNSTAGKDGRDVKGTPETDPGECVFKYYDVPDRLQVDVWKTIKEALNSRTDHSLSYMALWRFLKRFEHKSPVISAPRYRHGLYSNIRADSAQPSSRYLFSEHHAEIISEINRCCRNNSSSTSTEVVSRLKTRGIFVSCATVRRIRNHLGFKKATTKYCHAIRD